MYTYNAHIYIYIYIYTHMHIHTINNNHKFALSFHRPKHVAIFAMAHINTCIT